VIRLDLPADLSPADHWAVDTLVDLARLLPCEDAGADVVRLRIREGAGMHIGEGTVELGRELLARVTSVAGAGTEQGSTKADLHGRVPAEENPLVAAGEERRPIIQLAAVELRALVVAAAGRRIVRTLAPWPNGHRWAAAMTHDLDVVSGWPVFTALRALELLRKGRLVDIAKVLAAAAGSLGRGPVLRALQQVFEIERRHGIRSTWFILVGDPTLDRWRRGDVTYRLEDEMPRRCLEAIAAGGHEVGLHGSMETGSDVVAFRRERARLGEVSRTPPLGVRQHFLKMRPGATQAAMHQAGFRYDATYGFSGRNGFRLGVADPVRAWDARAGQTLPLPLVPLHWMDRALSKYQGVEDPKALVADGLALADEVRQAEGLWVGLWHPNLAPALGYPGAPEAFAEMVGALVERAPWFATLSEIVAWRGERRNLRATAVASDGTVTLDGFGLSNFTHVLEDGTGRRVA
jgi:peptidoglycan/xylan/chitin deacetylase (PgdA/CDA1 family)